MKTHECPYCGSDAELKVDRISIDGKVEMNHFYKCECGEEFATTELDNYSSKMNRWDS